MERRLAVLHSAGLLSVIRTAWGVATGVGVAGGLQAAARQATAARTGMILNGFNGFGLSVENPDKAFRIAVKGMLPKNKLADKQMTRMKLFKGAEHTHQAQIEK